MTIRQQSILAPNLIFGIPQNPAPIHNLPSGAYAIIEYSEHDYAKATLTFEDGRTEEWFLGKDNRERTILAVKETETMVCSTCALCCAVGRRCLSPLYVIGFPFILLYRFLSDDYHRNRAMLDNYCNR
jgi:hypothetical protein